MNDNDLVPLEWHNERRRVNDLVAYKFNPRILTETQAKHLMDSLKEFGLVEVPAIDIDNTIVAGHQRVKILMMLGRGNEEIDVRVPNRKLTEKEFKSYLVRSNKNTGEFDWEMLANCWEIPELLEIGFTTMELNLDEPLLPSANEAFGGKRHTCPSCGHEFTDSEEK